MQVAEVINEISEATGWKQKKLATLFGVSQGTISKWISTQQTPNLAQWEGVLRIIRRDPRLAHLRQRIEPGSDIPVMGRVGAGSIIEPDFEQIPPDGLYSVNLAVPVPDDMICFAVEGDSMMPKYDPGDVIIVFKEQRQDTASYLGRLVALTTHDGRRYLKKIFSGSAPGLYRLESFNAAPISDVDIRWIGEIYAILPGDQVFESAPKIAKKAPRAKTANAK